MLHTLHTPAATDAVTEAHRHAYNAAFHELDLNWHWDSATFARLQRHGRDSLRAYLEAEQAHLLRAYSTNFLVDLIETTKTRCHAAITRERHLAQPPGDTPARLAA